ncbi:MAG TPA: hypothetical protein VFH45_13310, partial [Acidimicrobiales bacterium]|nr:hypothetical protein [Acidimicrobiales bacterium]
MQSSGYVPRPGAELGDLAPIVARPGPFLTAYLNTEAAVENAAMLSEARWRSLRERLAADGAPEP